MNLSDGLYMGVDGCRGGWIACILDHGEFRLERFDSLEVLIGHYPEFDAFLIDMAVGLRSSADQLRPDDLARKELGQKSSSIFPIPCRHLKAVFHPEWSVLFQTKLSKRTTVRLQA